MDITGVPFRAYKGSDPYIFVSYAHKDSELVYPIISEFQKAGFPIWYDEGIDPGNEWPEEIGKALLKCSLFIVFITASSVQSSNVKNEINYALSKEKPFIHIWLEENPKLTPGLELQIQSSQGIMHFRMKPENFYYKCSECFEAFGIKRLAQEINSEEAHDIQEIEDKTNLCKNCGEKLDEGTKLCTKCGAQHGTDGTESSLNTDNENDTQQPLPITDVIHHSLKINASGGCECKFDGVIIQVVKNFTNVQLFADNKLLDQWKGLFSPVKKTRIIQVENYPFKSGSKTIEVYLKAIATNKFMVCVDGEYIGGEKI